MVLDLRAEPLDGCRFRVVDEEYGVRVSHRDARDAQGLPRHVERDVEHRAGALPERGGDLGRRQHGRAHVDAHASRARPAGPHHARERLDADLVGIGEAPAAHELVEAADPVGAHLDLGAVGVEDLHAEVGPLGRAHHQQLVGADAEVAIAKARRQRFERRQFAAQPVEHREVVARPVHLREGERLHPTRSPGMLSPRTRSSRLSGSRTTAQWPPRTSTSAQRGRPL